MLTQKQQTIHFKDKTVRTPARLDTNIVDDGFWLRQSPSKQLQMRHRFQTQMDLYLDQQIRLNFGDREMDSSIHNFLKHP